MPVMTPCESGAQVMNSERVKSTIFPVEHAGPVSTRVAPRQGSPLHDPLLKYTRAPHEYECPHGAHPSGAGQANPQFELLHVQQAPFPHVPVAPQPFAQFAPEQQQPSQPQVFG